MKKWHQPSGLSSGLPFTVDATWTPKQAMAVWDLLDDLRDRVWTHYGLVIQNLMREQHLANERFDDGDQDLPF
jgi:hypothetical protein